MIAAALLGAFIYPSVAFAAPPTAPAPPAAPGVPAKKVAYPLTGKVVSITATLLTIKGGEGKPDRTYAMTPQTVIVNGKTPATLADVKVGQIVGGRLEKAAAGDDQVLKINIGVKQDADKAPKPKKAAG